MAISQKVGAVERSLSGSLFHCSGDAAQDVHLFPRQLARLASWFRRGISFFGAAGSRKPIVDQRLLPVREQALHRARVGRRAGVGPRPRPRKPPSAWRQS